MDNKGKKPMEDDQDWQPPVSMNSSNFVYDHINGGSSFLGFNPNHYQNPLIRSSIKDHNTNTNIQSSSHLVAMDDLLSNISTPTVQDHDQYQNLLPNVSSSNGGSPSSPYPRLGRCLPQPDSALKAGCNQNGVPSNNPIIDHVAGNELSKLLEGSHGNGSTNPCSQTEQYSTESSSSGELQLSYESGFAEWGSTTGTSFLQEFEENNIDLLNVFNNIDHIKPPDHVFAMELATSDSALSAAPADHHHHPPPVRPPPPPPPPAAEMNLMASSSSRTREVLQADALQELARSDPKRARRIITNRKAALKANDKKKRYLLELEGRIHILQTKSEAYKSQLIMLEKNKDALQNEQDIMGKRLKCIVGEVNLQEKLNQKASEDVQNLRNVLGLKPTDDVMQLARRMIPALDQQTQPAYANSISSIQQISDRRRFVDQQVQWLQDLQAQNQQISSSQLMGAAVVQLPQALNQQQQQQQQQQSLYHQAPNLAFQSSPTTTQHLLPLIQPPSSSHLHHQLHSGHLILYNYIPMNNNNNNQSSSSSSNRTNIRGYTQGDCYQLQQFGSRRKLPPGTRLSHSTIQQGQVQQQQSIALPTQQGQVQQQQNAPPT